MSTFPRQFFPPRWSPPGKTTVYEPDKSNVHSRIPPPPDCKTKTNELHFPAKRTTPPFKNPSLFARFGRQSPHPRLACFVFLSGRHVDILSPVLSAQGMSPSDQAKRIPPFHPHL